MLRSTGVSPVFSLLHAPTAETTVLHWQNPTRFCGNRWRAVLLVFMKRLNNIFDREDFPIYILAFLVVGWEIFPTSGNFLRSYVFSSRGFALSGVQATLGL